MEDTVRVDLLADINFKAIEKGEELIKVELESLNRKLDFIAQLENTIYT